MRARNSAGSALYAIVPAAGRSRRMGRPKLLLPWGPHTVIEQVLGVLSSTCTAIAVVVRPDDTALAERIRHTTPSSRQCSLDVIVPPSPPADMRASVAHGLEHVASHCHPSDRDAWLLVPADQPTLRAEWITTLLAARARDPDGILVPTHAERRGHPVLFPWPLAAEVRRLPPETGVNQLLRTFAERVRAIPVPDPAILADMDTPDDYRRLCK